MTTTPELLALALDALKDFDYDKRMAAITALEAAKVGRLVMQEWQPIETAPKDGTPVDMWHKNGFRLPETWWMPTYECWAGAFDDSDFTHWMPIPAATSQEQIKST